MKPNHDTPNVHNFAISGHQNSSKKAKPVVSKGNGLENPNHFYCEVAPLLNIYKKRVEKPVEHENEDIRKSLDFPQSLKSFEIIHDAGLPVYTISSIAPDDTLIREEMEMRNSVESLGVNNDIKKILFKKNPGIGSLITEGSKRIDKVRQMLDGHRRKAKSKSSYLFPEGLGALTISEIEGDSTQRDERGSLDVVYENKRMSMGPSDMRRNDRSEENFERNEKVARFGRFSATSEEDEQLQGRTGNKSHYSKEKKDNEFSLMEEPFIDEKENRLDADEDEEVIFCLG